MTQAEPLALFALALRVLLLGCERIAFRFAGQNADTRAALLSIFFVATLLSIPFCEAPAHIAPAGLGWALLSGVVYAASLRHSLEAISLGEVSRIAPLSNLNIPILALLAALFLGEELTLSRLAGIAVITIGAALLSGGAVLVGGWVPVLDRPARAMLISAALLACARVIDRVASRDVPPSFYATLVNGLIATLLLVDVAHRRKLGAALDLAYARPKAIVASGACVAFSYLALLVAIRSLDVTVVEPISALGVLVATGLAKVVFSERISSRVSGTVTMLAGVALMFA